MNHGGQAAKEMVDNSTRQAGEQHFYLQQPGYESGYIIGKIEIERLIAEYARQREAGFVLKEFMDRFNQSGMIPVFLMYWELTGDRSILNAAIAGH